MTRCDSCSLCSNKRTLTILSNVIAAAAIHGDGDMRGNRAVCKPGFVNAAAKFVSSGANYGRTMLLYAVGPLGLKLRDEGRDNKDGGIGVSVFEVKEGCLAADAGVEVSDAVAVLAGQLDGNYLDYWMRCVLS